MANATFARVRSSKGIILVACIDGKPRYRLKNYGPYKTDKGAERGLAQAAEFYGVRASDEVINAVW